MDVCTGLHSVASVFEIIVGEFCPKVVGMSGAVTVDYDTLRAAGHADEVFAEVLGRVKKTDEELNYPGFAMSELDHVESSWGLMIELGKNRCSTYSASIASP